MGYTRVRRMRRRSRLITPELIAIEQEQESLAVEWKIARNGIAIYIAQASEPEEIENPIFQKVLFDFRALSFKGAELERKRADWWAKSKKAKTSKSITVKAGRPKPPK